MGRRANQRQPWTVYDERGTAFINATIAGERVRESLRLPYPRSGRASDAREVESAAAKRYAELVSGRVEKPTARIRTAHTLRELLAMWIVEHAKLYPRSKPPTEHSRSIARVCEEAERWAGELRTPIERIADDRGPLVYALARLESVLRVTVRKELVTLFHFYGWAVRKGHLAASPPRPKLPGNVAGVRAGPQRQQAVVVSDAEMRAIIAKLPEWSVRGGRGIGPGLPLPRGAYPVRDVFVLAYETGLRPATIHRLRVPIHWRRGSRDLTITADIDKRDYARTVRLTSAAIAVLERHAPAEGVIFPRHVYHQQLKLAAAAVLDEARAKLFAPYDARHGAARHMLGVSRDLLGVAYQLGHRRVTTTAIYLQTNEEHGRSVVDAMEAKNVSEPSAKGAREGG